MHQISEPPLSGARTPPRSTRDRILDSARALFFELGFKGATTRAIAQKAEVNETTLFRNFGSKENLLKELVERETDLTEVLAKLPEANSGDPIFALTEIALYIAGEMKSRIQMAKIVISETGRLDPEVVAQRAPLQGVTKITGTFRELGAKEPYIASVLFLSFILRAILFQAFIGHDPLVTLDRETIGKFVEIIVHGMKGA